MIILKNNNKKKKQITHTELKKIIKKINKKIKTNNIQIFFQT